MADVFLARDHGLGRDEAVKVLRPGSSLATGEQRFRREIETVSGLQHPNIVAVHDVGLVDGRIFFVTPFVSRGIVFAASGTLSGRSPWRSSMTSPRR